MTGNAETNLRVSDRGLVISRILNAPRELVFEVWTDPKHVAQWWGPDDFTNTVHEMNVKPGGIWRLTMHGPDGTDFPNKITYTEVTRPEKISYVHTNDNGSESMVFDVTITFTELTQAQTEIRMSMEFRKREEFEMVVKEFGAIEGAKQCLGRLAAYLAAQTGKK